MRTNQNVKVRLGMKGRLLGLILPIIVTVIGITLFVSLNSMKEIVEERTKEVIEYTTEGNAASMDSFLGSTLKELDAMKLCIKNSYLTEAQLKRLFQNTYGSNELYPEGLYYATSDGFYADGAGEENSNGDKIEEEQWFVEGLSHTNGFSYGFPYVKESNKEFVVTASIDLSTGLIKKVMAADIPMKILIDYVSEISFLNGKGRTILTNTMTGEVISKGVDIEGELLQNLIHKVREKEYGTTLVSDGSENYYATVTPISYCNLSLVSYVSREEVILSQVKEVILKVIVIVGIIVILSLFFIVRYISHKTSLLKKVTSYMETITDGNFTKGMTIDSRDEMGVMINSVEGFRNVMTHMILELNRIVELLQHQSDNSSRMSLQLTSTSTSQYNSMKQMQESLLDLGKSVEEIVGNSNILAADIGTVREKSEVMNQNLKEMVKISDSGQMEIELMGEAMKNIQDNMGNLSESVESVHQYMRRIRSMVESMEEIAEQSKLLSLNAAIEAVRANTDGKGFQVVAMEVNALAKNSADSVVRMKQVIDGIVDLVKVMKGKTESCVLSIQESKQTIENSVRTFQQITSKVQTVKEEVDTVTIHIGEVEGVSQNLVAITQEQSAASQQMFTMSEAVLEHTEWVKSNAMQSQEKSEDLTKMVLKLQEVLDFFKVNNEL
ncbi:methyl-accepting chemotaxis protein [Lachnoclostridium phytofermentans]|uniref:Methyl-accepting chemotaxis sensory transducer n=1 Tax=Lachnoclostridium phytofermentans (strain ATCC 700394 / DSM 18823 / ISDg) TaxID=357809 RepID=A9KJY1_LACP7|nr:methyl-accepting chemotaxis protein [Lachnoclostridium phytofermentans]ABX41136.1 methyl-accepting chemotaxis sensory transducer [Lachnoclostridium phytofermentans ISDg]